MTRAYRVLDLLNCALLHQNNALHYVRQHQSLLLSDRLRATLTALALHRVHLLPGDRLAGIRDEFALLLSWIQSSQAVRIVLARAALWTVFLGSEHAALARHRGRFLVRPVGIALKVEHMHLLLFLRIVRWQAVCAGSPLPAAVTTIRA